MFPNEKAKGTNQSHHFDPLRNANASCRASCSCFADHQPANAIKSVFRRATKVFSSQSNTRGAIETTADIVLAAAAREIERPRRGRSATEVFVDVNGQNSGQPQIRRGGVRDDRRRLHSGAGRSCEEVQKMVAEFEERVSF